MVLDKIRSAIAGNGKEQKNAQVLTERELKKRKLEELRKVNEKLKERHGEKSLPQKVIDTIAPAARETGSRETDILTVYAGINSGKPIKLEESDKYVDFFEPGLFHPQTEDMGDLDLDKKNLDLQKTGVDLSLKNLDLAELDLDLNSKDLDFDKKNADISQEKNLDHSNRENSLEFPLFD